MLPSDAIVGSVLELATPLDDSMDSEPVGLIMSDTADQLGSTTPLKYAMSRSAPSLRACV